MSQRQRSKPNFILALMNILFFLLCDTTIAQNFEWAKKIGGSLNDSGFRLTVDKNGNIYTSGFYQGTVDFDPGMGVFNLTSQGGTDVFISKLDSNDNFIWAKSMGGVSEDIGYSIEIDSFGNVYTIGFFDGIADFDPNSGTLNLTTTSSRSIFISKLDSSGNFIWAKAVERKISNSGSYSYNSNPSMTLDKMGNVYITSACSAGTIDFDPGLDTFNSTGGSVFVLKLDTSGAFVWVKKITGTESSGIAIDKIGSIYISGTSLFRTDIIISKLDSIGNAIWTKIIDLYPNQGRPLSIAVDFNNNIYTTGYFDGNIDFNPGAGVYNLTSQGSADDAFILKLDSDGNFIWAKNMGGTNTEYGQGIAVDFIGNVYTLGSFAGMADFDPNTGVYNLTSNGIFDIFISKLDTLGNFVWAKSFGGSDSESSYEITVDANDKVYTTGFFETTVDFDPNAGVYNLTTTGGRDIFIHKMSQPLPTPITKIENPLSIALYPNPSSGIVHLEIAQDFSIANTEIINTLGQVLERTQTSDKNSRLVLPKEAGIYFVRVEIAGHVGVYRVVRE